MLCTRQGSLLAQEAYLHSSSEYSIHKKAVENLYNSQHEELCG